MVTDMTGPMPGMSGLKKRPERAGYDAIRFLVNKIGPLGGCSLMELCEGDEEQPKAQKQR